MIALFQSRRPTWQRAYKDLTPGKIPVTESEAIYSVVDVETTGFELFKDRILSVAVARIEGGQLRANEIHDWIVFQKSTHINDATKVHGILPSETVDGISEADMLEQLVKLLTGTIVVGHHIQFDAAMLNIALERHFSLRFRNRIIDTCDMAISELDAFKKSGYSNQRPPSLDEVCQQLQINPVDRHTAIGDVFTTAQVFLYLKGKIQQRLKERFSVRSLPLAKF